MTLRQITCRRAGARDMDACLAIREIVFTGEQNVAPEIDRDGRDGAAIHFVAEMDGEPVATARARLLDDMIKIERVAVLRRARGTGTGAALMRFLMADLRDVTKGRPFFLSSQAGAIPFYERLGFVVCSEEYMDANIPHRDMRVGG